MSSLSLELIFWVGVESALELDQFLVILGSDALSDLDDNNLVVVVLDKKSAVAKKIRVLVQPETDRIVSVDVLVVVWVIDGDKSFATNSVRAVWENAKSLTDSPVESACEAFGKLALQVFQ